MRWALVAAALFLAWLSPAPGAGSAVPPLLPGRVSPAQPAVPEPCDEPPLPYLRGPSSWEYRSGLGLVRVRLDEGGVEGGARTYRWSIRLLGASMTEQLRLTCSGLFVARREFRLAGWMVASLEFPHWEPVILAPLALGRHWEACAEALAAGTTGTTCVEGTTQALEPVEVPAGRFVAYRIDLRRTDTWGSLVHARIWLSPEAGVVKADGRLRWHGTVGAVQQTLGLDHLHVELVEARLRHDPGSPAARLPPGAKVLTP